MFASYPRTEPEDQVLIQLQVEDIEVSGVILTRCVDDGSPYYVLNYDEESGRSDSVTSGRGVHKTVLVAASIDSHVIPVPWAPWGFRYPPDCRVSQTVYYEAGCFYLQDPSAMLPAVVCSYYVWWKYSSCS